MSHNKLIVSNHWALSPSSQEVWVLKVNRKHGEALVRYGDGTEQWLATALMRVARSCTCHPDDSPPVPCARKFALTDCRAAYDFAVEFSLAAQLIGGGL